MWRLAALVRARIEYGPLRPLTTRRRRLVTDNSMDLSLARFGRRRVFAREEDRHKPLRTACVWLVVLFIHLAFVAILVASGKLSPVKRIAQQEVYLLLPATQLGAGPAFARHQAHRSTSGAGRPARPDHIATDGSDSAAAFVRGCLGAQSARRLACGASSYEYLSEYARENLPLHSMDTGAATQWHDCSGTTATAAHRTARHHDRRGGDATRNADRASMPDVGQCPVPRQCNIRRGRSVTLGTGRSGPYCRRS